MSDTESMDLDESPKKAITKVRKEIDYDAAEREIDEKYPNRPHNTGKTFFFHELFRDLFDPLTENRKKPTASQARGRKFGPHAGNSLKPNEVRRALIDRFYSRWRKEVGDDIFPALRLILPDRDRERAMYGLKEKTLARFLVKIMRIDKNSEDAYQLINWKTPGQNVSKSAGDFAMRVFETVAKRAFRIKVGDMTVEDVNRLLDKLAAESKEEDQLPVIEEFYKRMNPEEIMWLVRIILKNMRVGATEKTFLQAWHPDAEVLYNVSSSLRRVCYELHSPSISLQNEERGVSPMQCFQPQLAFFSDRKQSSYPSIVASMKMTDDDQEFWIEEKLDGERMQLHMITEESGERKFKFWSRNAKEYTYLYGESFTAEASLTRHIQAAFADRVQNIIVDGEMITWNPVEDVMMPFGTLKTAALADIRNQYANGLRPLFRVFDILYLNGRDLTRYVLRDRRKALEASITEVHRRIEMLEYSVGRTTEDIERRLRKIVQEGSEGLVIKNPRSMYKVNDRNDDWIKVKPEYMEEFGSPLDCLIIGGFYGSGSRGGALSSFLCGLRPNPEDKAGTGGDSQRPNQFQAESQNTRAGSSAWKSFFKVGGGMTRDDYATIRHHTDGKWMKYNPRKPPTEYIKLVGGGRQIEQPDEWIKPEDSLVIEVKASAIVPSEEYAAGITLRFPRFKSVRQDKGWEAALTRSDLEDKKADAELKREENKQKKKEETAKARSGRAVSQKSKRPLTVAGYNARDTNNVEPVHEKSTVFEGLNIFIMTESTFPMKKSKLELEELVQANGGRVVQTAEIRDPDSQPATISKSKMRTVKPKPQYLDVICIAERRTVKVASLIKRGTQAIIRPSWILDCVDQARKDFITGINGELVIPFEPKRHLFFTPGDVKEEDSIHAGNIDLHGDSFARDTTPEELKKIMDNMLSTTTRPSHSDHQPKSNSRPSFIEPGTTRGTIFAGSTFYFDPIPTSIDTKLQLRLELARRTALFASVIITDSPDDISTTHIIAHTASDLRPIRARLAERLQGGKGGRKVPRVVAIEWIERCWEEETRVDEESIVF